ncbi:MAG: 50S ribosomal protein L32e [Candidatus Aenigmarchaeota archaeon]|nr:50S ribosomal protein L32e [Candidatus Aenigmarchaeota archaeon]
MRQGRTYLKRVGKAWRRPRGMHSKLKVKEKSKGSMPNVGYGAPREFRGLHPSGFKEVLIQNLKDLEGVDREKEAGRISSKVGGKKRKLIVERAKELKIKLLNE